MTTPKNPAAVALGRSGGQAKSPAKTASSRENGRKGGRPSNLSEFLRGFAETSHDADANAHWAAYSRQLSDGERERVEKGGYDAGRREGLAYRQL
jgi:hypothetical protein